MKNENIELNIAINNEYVRLYGIIIPILEQEKDRSVSKRLATKLEKAINNSNIYVNYNPDKYGSKEIHIYGGVIKYDNGITLRYGQYGDFWKAKTEQDTIDEEIRTSCARLENAKSTILNLTRELEQLPEMVKAYKKIAQDYKKACNDFVTKYGIDTDFRGITVSYTTQRELENITGEKIAI